jgi:hypothetical protein
MSFGIRPTYKQRVSVNGNNEDADIPVYDYEQSKKMVETMLQFSKKSGSSAISHQELENIIRKSSINPDFFPGFKDTVDEMMRSKREHDVRNNLSATTAMATTNTHGFSNSSTSSAANSSFRELLDLELRRELEKVTGTSTSNPTEETNEKVSEEDTSEEPNKGEDETDEQYTKRLEETKNRKMLSLGFPARASMLRGWQYRNGGSGGGIRRTPQGIVDAF